MASEANSGTTTNGKPTELGPEVFDDFDAFMKQAIRDYYDRSWKTRRGHFVALIIASGQAMSMAVDSVKDGSGLKKAALGAAGVVALRIGLRYALSGPLQLNSMYCKFITSSSKVRGTLQVVDGLGNPVISVQATK